MKICRNCYFWESSGKVNEEIYHQTGNKPPKDFLVGECKSIVLTHAFGYNKSAILADDEGGYWAAMYTAEKFGCNLYKEKK